MLRLRPGCHLIQEDGVRFWQGVLDVREGATLGVWDKGKG